MLSATDCIRKILDAATSNNLQQAIDALNDYATHFQLNKQSAGIAIQNDLASVNMEERRRNWPSPDTNHSLTYLP